jgi:tetratricopeptide (TPR) repeat protein
MIKMLSGAIPVIGVLWLLGGASSIAVEIPLNPAPDSDTVLCMPEVNFNELVIDYALHPSLVAEQQLDIEGYEQMILQLEAENGAYNYQLAAQLIGLGMQLMEAEENRQAAAAFRRALHIIRVNDGLNSPRQIPVLDLMIESNAAINEWQEVADVYDMMRWIFRYNYAEHDPRLLPVLKRIRHWHMNAYNKPTGRQLSEHYSVAKELYTQALQIIETCTNDHRQALCFWHRACCEGALPDYGVCPADDK